MRLVRMFPRDHSWGKIDGASDGRTASTSFHHSALTQAAIGMRIVFIGTGEIGVPTLQALLKSEHEVVGVVTQPDKPVGRSQLIEAPPIKKALSGTNIPVLQPARIKER